MVSDDKGWGHGSKLSVVASQGVSRFESRHTRFSSFFLNFYFSWNRFFKYDYQFLEHIVSGQLFGFNVKIEQRGF